jgi:hypothetical protein
LGELLGLGLTHFPPLAWPDDQMDRALQFALADPGIPDSAKDPDRWPDLMRAEAAEDRLAAAARHRQALVAGTSHVRAALDEFQPDVVVIWGDDQYELFREDVVPAFCVVATDELTFRPWRSPSGDHIVNVWDEPVDSVFHVPGHAAFGRELATALLTADFDIAYAYETRADRPFPHAVANTILFLDHERRGFPYPVVPLTVNCYGRLAIGRRGGMAKIVDGELGPRADPPGPSPRRCIQLGAAVARAALASDLRVALIASSSWSHAFLHDRAWRLYPDLPSDREYYDALVEGDHRRWHDAELEQVEASGQQEMLNWFCLVGAVDEAALTRRWSTYVETCVFNSNKCFAVFR